MATKQFGTRLKEILSSLDKNEKLTPAEFVKKVAALRNGSDGVRRESIVAAVQDPKFIKKVSKVYERSNNGRVVLYFKKGTPKVMTLERMITLQGTVKKAMKGLKRYYATRKTGSK